MTKTEELKQLLAALAADYANLCDKFCKSPERSEAYRAAVEALK